MIKLQTLKNQLALARTFYLASAVVTRGCTFLLGIYIGFFWPSLHYNFWMYLQLGLVAISTLSTYSMTSLFFSKLQIFNRSNLRLSLAVSYFTQFIIGTNVVLYAIFYFTIPQEFHSSLSADFLKTVIAGLLYCISINLFQLLITIAPNKSISSSWKALSLHLFFILTSLLVTKLLALEFSTLLILLASANAICDFYLLKSTTSIFVPINRYNAFFKRLAIRSVPIGFASFVFNLFNLLFNNLFIRVVGIGPELTVFNGINQLRNLVNFIPSSLSSIFLSNFAQKSELTLAMKYKKIIGKMNVLLLFVGVLIFGMSFFYFKMIHIEFNAYTTTVLGVALLSTFPCTWVYLLGLVLSYQLRSKKLLIINLTWSILVLILFYLLNKQIGASLAAMVSYLTAYVIINILTKSVSPSHITS